MYGYQKYPEGQRIDDLLTMYHEHGKFNGVVLVAEKGNNTFNDLWGYSNLGWNVTKLHVGIGEQNVLQQR